MKRGTIDHPKTAEFAELLDVRLYSAVGLLEMLWHATARHHPEGRIGKWPDSRIARALHWEGSAAALVKSLTDAGFLDVDPAYRLIVHDWLEHAEDSVKRYLKRKEQSGQVRTSLDVSPSRARALPEPFAPCPLPEPKPLTPCSPPKVGKRGKASRVPEGPAPEDWLSYANAMGLQAHRVYEEFQDYWRGVPGRRGVKADWPATFRNRCRDLEENGRGKGPPATGPAKDFSAYNVGVIR